jgi:hypothetical protein
MSTPTTDQKPLSDLKKFVQRATPFLKNYHTGLKADLEFAGGTQYTTADSDILGEGHAGFVFNLTGRYCEDIINLYRRRPYGIGFSAKRADAKETATKLNAIVKGWQNSSDFLSATKGAVDRQVKCGVGYVKLSNEYESETEGFNQGIKITHLIRPDMVLFDPYSMVTDGGDALEVAEVDHISESMAQSLGLEEGDYSDVDSPMDTSPWQSPEGFVPLVTYYKMITTKSKIYLNPAGDTVTTGRERDLVKMKSRTVNKTVCRISRIVGNKVIDTVDLPLSRIPIFPFRGKLIDRNGKQEWVGEVHDARDPARLVNWTASLSAERIAMDPKSSRFVDMKSIAPFKHIWQKSNRMRVPFLPYNSKVGDETFNAPVTDAPVSDITTPTTAQANFEAILASVLGSSQAGSMAAGAGNETAAAVLTRATSNENSKFVYADNAASAVKAIARVWLEYAGIVYDTVRTLPVGSGEDMDMQEIDFQELGVKPSEMDVTVDSGPLSDNQRKEALGALIALGTMLGPEAALVFSEDLAKNCDFDGSEEVAKKLGAYSASKLGISVSAEQDPEAVKALEMATQAHDALQERLDQANAYVNQLQQELAGQKAMADSSIAVEQIRSNNRLEVEGMKIQGAMSKEQMKILADSQQAERDAMVELEKSRMEIANRPVTLTTAPTYNSIDGQKNAAF